MPQKHDKLYNVLNGELQTVTYLQTQILEGASVETYTIRHADGQRATCPTDMYVPTAREAWDRYRIDCVHAIPVAVAAATAAQQHVEYCQQQLSHAMRMLDRCDAP